MKSESVSRKRKFSLGRKRLLGRGMAYRPYQDSDLKWLWAAYGLGAFAGDVEGGLTQKEFTVTMLEFFYSLEDAGAEIHFLTAKRPNKGTVPVGFVVVHYHEKSAWPHMIWFPWASARNKLETTVGFLQDLNSDFTVLVKSKIGEVAFLSHVARYGLLRRVGTIKKYYDGEDAILYQGV